MAVVGAGASGLAAAIRVAELGCEAQVLEAGKRAGRSILASGNGRCNFTNDRLRAQVFNAPSFVAPVLGEDPCGQVLSFFEGLGLWHVGEQDGRRYPASRAAASVLDVLLEACERLGVRIACESRVSGLERRERDGRAFWLVAHEAGEGGARRTQPFDAVIWAAGGGSADIPCACAGCEPMPARPILCPLATCREGVAGLDGVRTRCEVSLTREGAARAGRTAGAGATGEAGSSAGAGAQEPLFRERGEVLFRTYGVSGIVIFDVSRLARPGDTLLLDLAPDRPLRQLERDLRGRARARAGELGDPAGRLRFLDGALHPALALKLMRQVCGHDGARPFDAQALERLARLLKGYALAVRGTADESHAQVTRGGIPLDAVDASTLEIGGARGLFACGEALDIDAPCGGYNLSWAWLSGLRAAEGAARIAREEKDAAPC